MVRVALVEGDAPLRSALRELLRALGSRQVYAFADPEIAFHFLLARPGDVAVVVANDDDAATPRLLRRLQLLPASPWPVTYSGRRLARATARARRCPRRGADQVSAPGDEASAARARSSRTSSSPT